MDNKNIEIKSNSYTVDINNNKYELSLNNKDTHTLLLNKQGAQGKTGNGIISMVLIYADQEKSTYRINYTNGNFQDIDLYNGLSGTTYWGSILGDITNQTDLNNALNSKELLSNKTTSLTSSSTDTQYPSSKAVYDITNSLDTRVTTNENNITSLKEEKADKASIIMRSYNSQVGSTTNPIYVNTNGYVQPCNFDIGRYRFDGNVIYKYKSLTSTPTGGTYIFNLGSSGDNPLGYLPEDNYEYDIYFNSYCYYSGDDGTVRDAYISSSAINPTQDNEHFLCNRCAKNSRRQVNSLYFTVGSDKILTLEIKTSMTSFSLSAYGYRRVGTNS